MSQRPPGSGQPPITPRAPAPPASGTNQPRPDSDKLRDGLLLLPRFVLFLLQVIVFALGWILYQLGRTLIILSKLREERTPPPPPDRPLSSPHQPPNR